MENISTEILPTTLCTLNNYNVCVIDISNNKELSIYHELLECPICLDPIILDDSILTLNCCKNKVHLKCICEWYHNNTSKVRCFICNQTNPFEDQVLLQSSIINRSLIQRETQEQIHEAQEQCTTIIRMLVITCFLFLGIISIVVFLFKL